MSLTIDLDYLKDIENQDFKIDPLKFQKMLFLFNTIEDGWSVKKKDDNYVFTKKNNNKKEVLKENYLMTFMKANLELHKYI